MNIYRHGDVLLREILEIPSEAKLVKKANVITVALGEATGHHHTLYGSLPMSLLQFDERRFLEIIEIVDFKHQQHGCLKIDPTKYEIEIEREHDYFTNEIRIVTD